MFFFPHEEEIKDRKTTCSLSNVCVKTELQHQKEITGTGIPEILKIIRHNRQPPQFKPMIKQNWSSLIHVCLCPYFVQFQVSKRFMDKTQKERVLHALQRLEQNIGKVRLKLTL